MSYKYSIFRPMRLTSIFRQIYAYFPTHAAHINIPANICLFSGTCGSHQYSGKYMPIFRHMRLTSILRQIYAYFPARAAHINIPANICLFSGTCGSHQYSCKYMPITANLCLLHQEVCIPAS